MSSSRRPLWVGLMLAVATNAAAIGLRLSFDDWLGDRTPLMPLFLSVAVAAWVGGLWPGLLATILGVATGAWMLLRRGADGHPPDLVWLTAHLLTFAGIGVIVSWLGEALHRTRRRERTAVASATAEEAERRANEERFRVLADLVPQIVFVTRETDGRVEYLNDRWHEYVGHGVAEPAEVVAVIHPDDRERVAETWKQARTAGKRFTAEMRIRRHDGTYRWFLTRAMPSRDAAGQLVRWYGTSTDIHDQKMGEQALRDADRRKDAFLATLAHELKTPLAPIANGVRVLERGADADTATRVRGMIGRQLTHLSALVDDLLDVSRIGRGKLSVKRQAVDLTAVARQAVEAVTPLAEGQGQRLSVSLPDEPVLLSGDRTRLAQVVSNLLTNAVRYTPAGGRIELSVRREDGHAVLTVADTGRGIPADILPRIFGLFDQGNTTDTAGGLGIGLALVKGLVEVHGGSVTAHSDGQGRGSTFTVRLPCNPPAEDASKSSVTKNRPKQGTASPPRRVLVADDNADAADSLALILEMGGHDVKTAYDGEQAVAAAEALRPHLILMDVGMPKLDGLDAARRIRRCEWAKGCRIVALTGWGQDSDREKSAAAGCDDHWVKPVSPETVADLLATLPGEPAA